MILPVSADRQTVVFPSSKRMEFDGEELAMLTDMQDDGFELLQTDEGPSRESPQANKRRKPNANG